MSLGNLLSIGVLLSFAAGSLRADTVIFTTGAQATIYDGSHNGSAGPYGAADGIPDHFDFARTPSPVLNAFLSGTSDSWQLHAVTEFDIQSLSGESITSASAQLLGGWSSANANWDGQIELTDFNNTANQLAVLPGEFAGPLFSVDITSFLRDAVAANQQYIGFTLWQASTTNGIGIMHLTK